MEQLAAHLRAEIAASRLGGTMPGVIRLVEELGVGTKMLEKAAVHNEFLSGLHPKSDIPAFTAPLASVG